MNDERFGQLFCLIHESGDVLYPVQVKNRDTGKIAFRVSKGGKGGNTKTLGREEQDEETVLRLVEQQGYLVRARTRDGLRQGLFNTGEGAVCQLRKLK